MTRITDANGYDYGDYPAERDRKQQTVTNMRWPATDDSGHGHARTGITYLDERPPATATIHFSSDGTTQVDGWVTRVANGCVYFEAADERLVRFGVWLSGEDVRRRS